MTTYQMKVAISKFHEGQICYPTVQVFRKGKDKVRVELVWIDQSVPSGSPGREYDAAEFTGTVAEAEKFLAQKGVHLGGQGIY